MVAAGGGGRGAQRRRRRGARAAAGGGLAGARPGACGAWRGAGRTSARATSPVAGRGARRGQRRGVAGPGLGGDGRERGTAARCGRALGPVKWSETGAAAEEAPGRFGAAAVTLQICPAIMLPGGPATLNAGAGSWRPRSSGAGAPPHRAGRRRLGRTGRRGALGPQSRRPGRSPGAHPPARGALPAWSHDRARLTYSLSAVHSRGKAPRPQGSLGGGGEWPLAYSLERVCIRQCRRAGGRAGGCAVARGAACGGGRAPGGRGRGGARAPPAARRRAGRKAAAPQAEGRGGGAAVRAGQAGHGARGWILGLARSRGPQGRAPWGKGPPGVVVSGLGSLSHAQGKPRGGGQGCCCPRPKPRKTGAM
jgi:hypothetical protein